MAEMMPGNFLKGVESIYTNTLTPARKSSTGGLATPGLRRRWPDGGHMTRILLDLADMLDALTLSRWSLSESPSTPRAASVAMTN